MSGNSGGQIYAFEVGITGGARPNTNSERRRRRANYHRSGPLLGVALVVLGLGLVVVSEWLHPSGPIEDPLATQQPQTTF